MLRKTAHVVIVALSLAVGATLATSAVAAPSYPVQLGQAQAPAAEPASFWARPYPYGYAYRTNPCIRHVRVETRYGWRWRRVWICD